MTDFHATIRLGDLDELDTSHASSDSMEALTDDVEVHESVIHNKLKLMTPVQDDWDNENCFDSTTAVSLQFQQPLQQAQASEAHNHGARCNPSSITCPREIISLSSQTRGTKG